MREREDRIFIGTIAVVVAVLLLLFVFGRGPGSLVWLSGGGAPRWLPFAGSGVSWLPFVNPRPVAALQPAPSPVQASPSPTPSPKPPTPSPSPIAQSPSPRPSPKPSPSPSPSPVVKPPSPSPSPSPKPSPSPSPTQTTLFSDNFEQDAVSSSVPGWSESSGGWSVTQDGSHVLTTDSGEALIAAGSTSWTNYKVTATIKDLGTSGYARVLARYQSSQYFYACGLDGSGNLFLGKTYGGTWYTFATTAYSVTPGTFYSIAFTVNGNSLTCAVTDALTGRSATVTSSQSYFASGSIGAAASSGAEFDNFVVTTI